MATLIQGAKIFDGSGKPTRATDLLIGDSGKIERMGQDLAHQLDTDVEVMDATDKWVTPGFVDIHTHYDAELEIDPALTESIRHGVTTTLIGSCGLSLVMGTPEDLADTFCRVEGIPRSMVLPLLESVVDWSNPTEYVDHLKGLALGPNIISMLGHSTLRTKVLGIERALSSSDKPTDDEQKLMQGYIEESFEAGMIGVSVNTLPWDKMGGTRFRSMSTPSVYAKYSEYRWIAELVRDHDGVFQALPNLQTRYNLGIFANYSRPRRGKALRTSLLTMMDARPAMGAYRAMGTGCNVLNNRFGANVRFQALPNPFAVYTDGIENPIFEELAAGTEALHIENLESRRQLMRAPIYRDSFRKQWKNKVAAHAYHRDLTEARIMSCPDQSLEGQTFAAAANARGKDPLEFFLDLQGQYGNDLRWYTVVANANAKNLEWIISHPVAMIGFSDAGAHLRNMAFYNFPLRMLKRVRDASRAGRPFMSLDEAVFKLTADLADFHDVDTGRLKPGAQADLVIINPERLDESVEQVDEAPMTGLPELARLVNRNDDTVEAVYVRGKLAWTPEGKSADLGKTNAYGRFLAKKTA